MIPTREKQLTEMRSLHDMIKELPYWMTFDIKLLNDVIKNFRKLTCCVWKSSDETNPYYVILRCVTHDFNAMLSSMPYWVKDGEFEEKKADIIMVLQTYLMNVHRLLDNERTEEVVVGYTYSTVKGICKFQAEWDEEEKKYYAVNIIKTSQVPAIRKWCKKYADLGHLSNTKEYAVRCIEELDKGEKIIGKHWKIVE
jgi:hypothetical protein